MLTPQQARELKQAGLDFYNHNLDTSAEYYAKIITTRTYQDRLDTLNAVRESGMRVCCGGIVGMGEGAEDRIAMLHTLSTLLADTAVPDPFDFVRTIATARILMPRSHVRLAAGRNDISDELQALCFMAGANSIFYGEKLLTTGNPDVERDRKLLARLRITPEPGAAHTERVAVA
jgi:biotin synthase